MSERKEKDEARQNGGGLSPTMTAVFIGFLVGILVYSAAQNAWGLVTLVPLFLIYRLLKQ